MSDFEWEDSGPNNFTSNKHAQTSDSQPTENHNNVTSKSDSESDSDSGTESESSDSSSSSSSSEEESSSPSKDMNSFNQTQNDEPGSILSQNSSLINSIEEFHENTDTLQVDALSLENQCLENSGNGLLDELQQFLSSDSGSLGASVPVDPVFVDHEDSQNANNLDSLVFDNEEPQFRNSDEVQSIPGMEDINEPRLDSLCSNINSTESSLILADLREDGELPSSPENDGFNVDSCDNNLIEDSPSNYNSKNDNTDDREPVRIKDELDKTSHSSSRPLDSDHGDNRRRKYKKSKRKKDDAKESDDEMHLSPPRRSKPKKSRRSHDSPSRNQCHSKVESDHSLKSNPTKKPCENLSPLKSVLSSSLSKDSIRTNFQLDKKSERNPKSSSSPRKSILKPEVPPSDIKKDKDVPPVPETGATKSLNDSKLPSTSVLQSDRDTPRHSSDMKEKKSKKLSVKDYKAKKEAEKLRRSMEESGNESGSSSSTSSLNTSKEGSPEPSVRKDETAVTVCVEDKPPVSEDNDNLCPNSDLNIMMLDPVDKSTEDADASVETTSTMEIPGQSETRTIDVEESLPMDVEESTGQESADLEDNDADILQGFDVLDEIDDIESEEEPSKDSDDDDLDSLADDELEQLLDADIPKPAEDDKEQIEPEERMKKLVLEERGGNFFDVLPRGWVSVTHNSGMPVYLHRESRVVTTSRPYDLGNGSVRKHNIPISAIPCYNYRYYSKETNSASAAGETDKASPENAQSSDSFPSNSASSSGGCPFSGAGNDLFRRDNVSPDSTTDGVPISSAPAPSINSASDTPSTSDASNEVKAAEGNVFPKAQIETIEETLKKTEMIPEEVNSYCKKLFVFKELEVAKFKTWKERRAFYKQTQRNKLEKDLLNRPTLPEGTKIITIPTLEMQNIPGTEGDSAIHQKVVKKSKKKWMINPVGKSMVCILHEYVQQSLKMQPHYEFTELDNAATPYCATVIINKIEYGRGTGSSKKIAKSEAARITLEMLIPDIKDKLPQSNSTKFEDGTEGPDLSFFDDIKIEDPRVAEFCNRTSEPAPFQILVTCLQRNYGLGDTHISQEMKLVRNGKNEYIMKVGKKEVSVICKNKKDGKQLAAAKLLQQLHPHVTNWGSLLRLYGNRSMRKFKIKRVKEEEVTGLQSRNNPSSVAPSVAILEKLKEEMRNLREIKKSIAPIGKFLPPEGVGQTGLNTDHVDF